MMRITRCGFTLALLAIIFFMLSPYPLYSQVFEHPFILDPTYSIAQIVRPGSWFIAYIRDPSGVFNPSIARASLSCYIEGTVNLSLLVVGYSSQAGVHSLNISIPGVEIPSGMFSCTLALSDGKNLLLAERAVYLYNKSMERLGILHISDVHILLPTPIGTAYQTLTSAVFLANMLGDVDVVINTGDTIDRPGDASLYTYYKRALRALLKPVLAVPGNHDGSGIKPEVFTSVYGSSVGSATWYRRFEGFLIVGLDTSTMGVIDRTQLLFLERILQQNIDAGTKILLLHHPVFRASAKGIYIDQPLRDVPRDLLYASWAQAEDIAREFLRIIDLYNVSAVLAGHVHQDSIVIYRNKTIFITTGTLGGPRSYYNAFRIIDAFPNGTVVPRYASGTSAESDMNSFNVEKAIVRYWVDRGYSGVYINISRDIGLSFGDIASIYIEAPGSGATADRILYDTGYRQTLTPSSMVEILGDDGVSRIIYRFDIEGSDIYRPQAVIVKSRDFDTSVEPSITGIYITPQYPRPGIDPITVSVEVSRGSTFIYRVETVLRASIRGGGLVELIAEALPSWDYSAFTAIFDKINAVNATIGVRAYDLYGNSASAEIPVRFRELPTQVTTAVGAPQTQTRAASPTPTTVSPTVLTTAATEKSASPIAIPPTTITAAAVETSQQQTTGQAQTPSGDSGLAIAILIAFVGIAIVVSVAYARRRK